MTEPTQALWRTPGGRDATFWWRAGTNDWNTLCSCLNEDEYGLNGVEAATVVDIGGYLGGVGIGFAVDHPEARVWIVEPLTANVELIARNIEDNGLGDRVTLLHRAADRPGRKDTTVRWSFGDDETGRHHRFVGNSTLSDHSTVHESEPVSCIDLGSLVQLAGGRIDLLKIDCEGAEYDILSDADALSHVGIIRGEYHDGRDRLQRLLEATHVVTATGTDHFGGFSAVAR